LRSSCAIYKSGKGLYLEYTMKHDDGPTIANGDLRRRVESRSKPTPITVTHRVRSEPVVRSLHPAPTLLRSATHYPTDFQLDELTVCDHPLRVVRDPTLRDTAGQPHVYRENNSKRERIVFQVITYASSTQNFLYSETQSDVQPSNRYGRWLLLAILCMHDCYSA
jgi:hypothetical protein